LVISSELLAIVFGLASATAWGAAGFSGGFATKSSNVYSVVVISQIIGTTILVVITFLLNEEIPSPDKLFLGATAGVSGTIGLVAYYSGLASGRMGIVAPVAAVVSVVPPVFFGFFIEGLPSTSQLVGFGLALFAVWLLTSLGGSAKVRMRELGFAVAAGLGFCLFFIIIDRVSESAVLWPLVSARAASISFLFIFATVVRKWEAPVKNKLPIIVLVGIFETSGTSFFVLATHVGRLDIAAVLASLYPASTVLLARLMLKERLIRQQWIGVIATVIALALIVS
jgi:drug/metabolite transporter (DMT)-like permease